MFSLNGKNYTTLAEYGVAALVPASKVVKVDPSSQPFDDGQCRGLWVGTAGTANLQLANGNIASDFPLLTGWNPFCVVGIDPGGTADDIWAVYE